MNQTSTTGKKSGARKVAGQAQGNSVRKIFNLDASTFKWISAQAQKLGVDTSVFLNRTLKDYKKNYASDI